MWQYHQLSLVLWDPVTPIPQGCLSGTSTINGDVMHSNAQTTQPFHDDVIKWKHFPRYWPFVRGIHRSRHRGQWRGASMFSLICAWTNDWVNNREAGDLRRHHSHYDVNVMPWPALQPYKALINLILVVKPSSTKGARGILANKIVNYISYTGLCFGDDYLKDGRALLADTFLLDEIRFWFWWLLAVLIQRTTLLKVIIWCQTSDDPSHWHIH